MVISIFLLFLEKKIEIKRYKNLFFYIIMLDLYNKKYSREELKQNIYAVKLRDIIITQTLDVSFIVKYILNPKYQFTEDDEKINIEMVLQFQPHINREVLNTALYLYNSDDDSVEDFESVSNKY
jgi:hypothetical protein